MFTLDGLMRALPEHQPRRAELLQALSRMVDVVDPGDVAGTAAAGRAELAEVLARPAYASAHRIVAVGHAHIDSAWLWPVRETIRKCARTFANVVALADADPTFKFACSSAQQYAWVKEHYPDLFARITEKVAAGQFLPVGGMWVESDTNMPGGEAMARQFVAGKRFFVENFGVETEEVWLPDSFGYSAALPQIVRASGSKYLLTQKLSWNQTNTMPHNTFAWEGIDGTRVLTHFPPVNTYNSDLSGRDLARAERNYAEHGKGTISLVPFGWGDGGGGPTREMLAAAHRTRSLEGSPAVRIDSPAAFFAEAAAENPDLPVWSGELYLELHRATYTTQARTKQGNRVSEHLLREAELWAATAAVRTGADYPYDELEELWQLVLLQQFHDILPGSSDRLGAPGRRAQLCGRRAAGRDGDHGSSDPAGRCRQPHLRPERRPALSRHGVAPLGAGVPVAVTQAVKADRVGADIHLDNGIVRVVIGERGQITSLTDYASGREAIAAGTVGNRLQLHRDIPNLWDAWDVDEHYRRNVTEIDGVDAIDLDTDDDRAVVRIRRSFGSSTIEQQIILRGGLGVGRDPQRHRLARAQEAAQARFRLRRARRPVGLRDPVRPCVPPHPYQHVLGVRPVRDLRPPVDPRRRTRLRRGGQQRLHLRPRRRSYDARARWHHHHRALVVGARFPLSRPRGRPGPAHQPDHRPPGGDHRRCRRRGLPHQPAAPPHQGRAGRQAAGQHLQSGHRGRSGQTGRGSQRRRRCSAVRVLGRTRRG